MLNVAEAILNVTEAMLKCCRGYDLQYTISRDAIASKKNVRPPSVRYRCMVVVCTLVNWSVCFAINNKEQNLCP